MAQKGRKLPGYLTNLIPTKKERKLIMYEQNIFDNDTFFRGYKELRKDDANYNIQLEQPAMRKLLPDVKGKFVLDLGCGYGCNCLDFIKRGATGVIGIDIS